MSHAKHPLSQGEIHAPHRIKRVLIRAAVTLFQPNALFVGLKVAEEMEEGTAKAESGQEQGGD